MATASSREIWTLTKWASRQQAPGVSQVWQFFARCSYLAMPSRKARFIRSRDLNACVSLRYFTLADATLILHFAEAYAERG